MSKIYSAKDISIAIPTFGRDQVLIDTVECCLKQSEPAGEILVLDQTPQHDEETEKKLRQLDAEGKIRWLKLTRPSQPAAMNVALREANGSAVLYLDDDVIPNEGFVAAHARSLCEENVLVAVGQIIQPWQKPSDVPIPKSKSRIMADFDFPFHSIKPAWLENVMSGHMSVVKEEAIRIGGFDENFFGAAYRFDTEFGRRIRKHGGKIKFTPEASLFHIRAVRGGTRSGGNHLTSPSPHHGIGDHYFALLEGNVFTGPYYCITRILREVRTKFHLTHPWWIPVKILGEVRAFLWALQLRFWKGPALLSSTEKNN